jgi:diguanylate cyclase (GGDEF)-like protein/PAS domain S-box-containing protein
LLQDLPTEHRLEEQVASDLDTVPNPDVRALLSRDAGDPLHHGGTAKPATILIVDDDIQSCKLLEVQLLSEGYRATTAASGEEALASIAQHAPDLILLDILLPDMDGYRVARILKGDSATASIPIIIATVVLDERARLAGLKAGAEEFLTKPINRVELGLRVRNLLRLKAFSDFLKDHSSILEQQVLERTADLRRFRAAMEISGDAIFLIDRSSMRYIDVNQPLCDMVGYTRQEVLGMTPMDLFNPSRETLEREYDALIANGGSAASGIEGLYHRKVGPPISIESRRGALRTESGWVIVGTARDITERKEAEAKIVRLNRVYAVLSGINSAIVRIRESNELYAEICRLAVSEGGFFLARVVEFDSNKKARIAATSERDSQLFQRIVDEYNSNPEHSNSMLALALRSGHPLISNDVAGDQRIPDRVALTKEGNYALALLPIIVEMRVAGTIVLRTREAGMFDEAELRLLLELVSNLSFALELMDKQQKITHLAYYDPLTGLANRALFHQRLTQYMHIAQPGERKLAVILMDLERFKTINDSLGRPAGDELLKQLAGRLGRAVDPADVARIGGDQFAILVPEIKGRSEIGRSVERIWRECFAEPFQVTGHELRISAKAGIALYPNDGIDADGLFSRAEAALQKAKETGERHQFHSREMTARVAEQLALENKLRQALERNEFVLHYQPKVDLETRRIVGVEALIRWQSPELGLVPPMQFIPLMEETGMILDVGAWALSQAVADHSRWLGQGIAAPRVAVNVSAIQLRRRDFVATVKECLKHGATPTGIDLEITESLIMTDVQGNIEKLKAVRDLGVSIAIDDFGTGYSSLGYLTKLPVQTLKIDRSFVITMLKDPGTMLLVQTIISLAHSLRLKVIAEGVDEEEQAKVLNLLRCDEIQGYLFSRPVPFDKMTALLIQEQKTMTIGHDRV